MIKHIGGAHNKVEEFLPESHRIAKTRRGFYSDKVTPAETTEMEQIVDHSQTEDVVEMDTPEERVEERWQNFSVVVTQA